MGAPIFIPGGGSASVGGKQRDLLLGLNTGTDTCDRTPRQPSVYVDIRRLSCWIHGTVEPFKSREGDGAAEGSCASQYVTPEEQTLPRGDAPGRVEPPSAEADRLRLWHLITAAVLIWRCCVSVLLNAALEENVGKAAALRVAALDWVIWAALGAGSLASFSHFTAKFTRSHVVLVVVVSAQMVTYATCRLLCLAVISWYRDATWMVVEQVKNSGVKLDKLGNWESNSKKLSDGSIACGWQLLKSIPAINHGQEWIRQVRALVLITSKVTSSRADDISEAAAGHGSWSSGKTLFRDVDKAVTGGVLWGAIDSSASLSFSFMSQMDGCLRAGYELSSKIHGFMVTRDTASVDAVQKFSWQALWSHLNAPLTASDLREWSEQNRRHILNMTLLFLFPGLWPTSSAQVIVVDLSIVRRYASISTMWWIGALSGLNLFWMDMERLSPTGPKWGFLFVLTIILNFLSYHSLPLTAAILACNSCLAVIPVFYKGRQIVQTLWSGGPVDTVSGNSVITFEEAVEG
eukprot:evm.model.scf_1690.3 EVM.evm.TU.scf_1690.3   scf_1690:11290-12843(-)